MTERFELLEQLGKGGMGTVWKARDHETGEIVALKLLHSIYIDDPDYVARFEREVDIARLVKSPHVVEVHGYGRHQGTPFVAMEYVDGMPLSRKLRQSGPMTWEDAKPLLRQVAEGLAAAHEGGVIHRDIKPSNILLDTDGNAKLADFGIARAADITRITGSATVLGTPAYMAPEGTPSEQGDLYGLGCVAFELLTGSPPFSGDSHQEVWLKHLREPPDLNRIPADARDIVGWLLAKDPSRRAPTAEALLAVLGGGSRNARGGLGALSRRTTVALSVGGLFAVAAIVVVFALGERGQGVGASAPGAPPSQQPTITSSTISPVEPTAMTDPTVTVSPTNTLSPTPTLASLPTAVATTPSAATLAPTATPVPATPTPGLPDADGDGIADAADACPVLAGAWVAGCPKPTAPDLGVALRPTGAIRVSAPIPLASKLHIFIVVSIRSLDIFTSAPVLTSDGEVWYDDVDSYYDEQGHLKTFASGESYCFVARVYYQPKSDAAEYVVVPAPATYLQLPGQCLTVT